MNLLIIGGLFVVGILALVGAIFLGMSEQRAARNNHAQPELPAAPAAAPPTSTVTRQLSQPAQSVPTQSVPVQSISRPLSETPTMVRSTPGYTMTDEPTFAGHESTFANREPAHELPTLNGQFHEVVREIRTLHQQASQLEQRLNSLTELVNRLERTQTNRPGLSEDPYSIHDNTMQG